MRVSKDNKIHINYDSMEELLNRQNHIENTLQNYLTRNNNNQYIKDTNIIVGENKFSLVITLDNK